MSDELPAPLRPDQYRCAACGGVFEKGWTDEEAQAEMQNNWGAVPKQEQVLVCDVCHERMNPATHPEEVKDFLSRN